MSNLIGQILLNQYRVDHFIAAGGMGAVYRVWDTKRNVPLAMKVLHSDLLDDPTAFKSFQREANALRKLAHPHIVPFFGLYSNENFAFILEKYIDGPSLKDVMRKYPGGMPVKTALACMTAICSALGYAHANGVVHCDIKPGNVMLDRSGQIYLADFGIARHENSTTTTMAGAGSPAYMAPEQILLKPVTPATDVYALGVLFFEMLTGQRPFNGNEVGAETAGNTSGERIRYAHRELPPPQPSTLNPGISQPIEDVILRALSKSPKSRYVDAAAFYLAAAQSVGFFPQNERLDITAFMPPGQPASVPVTAKKPVGLNSLMAGAGFLILLMLFFAFQMMRALPPKSVFPNSGQNNPALSDTLAPTVLIEADLFAPVEPTVTKLPTATQTTVPSTWQQGRLVFGLFSANRTAIYIQDLGAGTPQQLILPSSNVTYEAPVFSPNGSTIAFYVYRTDVRLIDTVPDSSPRILKSGCTEPTWSPDGGKILCRDVSSGTFQLIDSQNGSVLQTTNIRGVIPNWSPVSDDIVFARLGEGRSSSIWLFSLSEQTEVKLADFEFQNYMPVWSPDGNWIAFHSGPEQNRSQIWIMDKNGGSLRQVTTVGQYSRAPVWSPDGKWIGFVSDAAKSAGSAYGDFFVISLETGEVKQVTDTNGQIYDWRVSWTE